MATFSEGQVVYSRTGKEYRIVAVYDHGIDVGGTSVPVASDAVKGVRYGVRGVKGGILFGPYRNLYDTTAFAENPT